MRDLDCYEEMGWSLVAPSVPVRDRYRLALFLSDDGYSHHVAGLK
jgi:hypothetical protein